LRMPAGRASQASSRASFGFCVADATWTPDLRLGYLVDFCQHHGRIIFQGYLHSFEILFGIFPGAVLEAQIAKVIVNSIAALHQMIELGAMRSEIGSIRLNVENEKQRSDGQSEAGAEHCAVR